MREDSKREGNKRRTVNGSTGNGGDIKLVGCKREAKKRRAVIRLKSVCVWGGGGCIKGEAIKWRTVKGGL